MNERVDAAERADSLTRELIPGILPGQIALDRNTVGVMKLDFAEQLFEALAGLVCQDEDGAAGCQQPAYRGADFAGRAGDDDNARIVETMWFSH
jgi:hypothetical protein